MADQDEYDEQERRAQEQAAEMRRTLGAAVQQASVEFKKLDEDEVQQGVVIGWVTVAEVLDPSGERWLTQLSADAAGESLPRWQVQGYAHSVLHDWPVPDDDDDE